MSVRLPQDLTIERAFRLDDLVVDPRAGAMSGPGGREQLDPKVMAVFTRLAARAGQVVPREELLRAVWSDVVVTDDALSRCIYQLRRHLHGAGGHPRYRDLLETLPKRGYRLHGTVRPAHLAADGAGPSATAGSRNSVAAWWTSTAVVLLTLVGVALWQLVRADFFWRDPLADARFSRLTDFDGVEEEAAISRDGSLVAFLSDRDGAFDVWTGRIVTGEFRNLTTGRAPELRNPAVRVLDFSPVAPEVVFWMRDVTGSVDLHAVPINGGELTTFAQDVAELAWSSTGTRKVYHPAADGDPMFVTEPGEKVGRQIFAAPNGLHAHFPIWSPDDQFVYFVHGRPPNEMDVWRIAASGGAPERITFHGSRVESPVFVDEHTLLYLATEADGSGPWIYGMNVERRVPHRLGAGLRPYTSLAASADGSRIVATVTTQQMSLWRVPVLDRPAQDDDSSRIDVPGRGARSPRFAGNALAYLSPTGGGERLWILENGQVREVWSDREGRVVSTAGLDATGRRFALTATLGDKTRLLVFDVVEGSMQTLAPDLDVHGAPAWCPDGTWIAVGADRGGESQLFKVPLDGEPAVPIVAEYSLDPAFSPDGRVIAYRGAESGPSFALKVVTADGARYDVPELILPRGANRFEFLPPGVLSAGLGLVVLKGELLRKNFWVVDLDNGDERQLTDFGPGFIVTDFDVSADGLEIVFDRIREETDLLLIERTAARR